MKNKKSQKGITIIALVLTIIILLILASVATYTGIESYDRAEQIKFVSQMQLIQTKVDEVVQKNDFASLGDALNGEQKNIVNSAVNSDGISWPTTEEFNDYVRYFSKEKLRTQLELDNIDEDIIINFKTREVISTVGFEYGGTTYYTQYKLPKGEKLTQYEKPNTTLSFEYSKTAQDLTSILKIVKVERTEENGNTVQLKSDTLKYELWKKENDNYVYLKQINPNETLISIAGEYKIKVIDNVGNEYEGESFVIRITNPPRIEKNWSKIVQIKGINSAGQKIDTFTEVDSNTIWYDYSSNIKFAYSKNSDSDYLVWIPRYAKNNSTNEIKFIKGNSNIFEDNTKMNDDWTVPEEFSQNGIKLTGFWLKVTEPNSEDKNIDEFLKNINKEDIVYVYE